MIIDKFDTKKSIFLIAEIGNNHEGNFDVALSMIEEAKKAGADAVKFQTIVPEELVSYDQTERIGILNRFKFSREQFSKLKQYSDDLDIIFFSTPFDLSSAQFLNDLQSVFKIASSDNTFWPLIDKISSFKKNCIISTGCMDMEDVRQLVKYWKGSDQSLALLHCVSAYPVPIEEANLGAILALKKAFPNITIGYSDHTLGIEAALLAGSLGARIIEKHFTLDHDYSNFRDHQLSANPKELKSLAEKLKKMEEGDLNFAEKNLGEIDKKIQASEKDNKIAIRRSIASNRDLGPGHTISQDDLMWVRPGTGFSPGMESLIIGRQIKTAYKKGQLFESNDLI